MTETAPRTGGAQVRRRIAVIIPFYQKDTGVLAGCLRSVFAQELPEGVEIDVIVVDDGSPAPVADDLVDVSPEDQRRLIVITQANGGPAAARNTGLERAAQGDYEFIAFNDSDDQWRPNHLAEAVEMLDRGYDFYTCDQVRFNTPSNYFSEGEATNRWLKQPGPEVTFVDVEGPVLAIEPRAYFSAVLREYIPTTPTIVFRFDKARDQRFDTSLYRAGEDHLFWLQLVDRGLKPVISFRVNVEVLAGLNIYAGAYDFSNPRVVRRVGNVLLFALRVRALFSESYPEDAAFLSEQVTTFTRGYGYLLTRSLLMGQKPDWELYRRILREKPSAALLAPLNFLKVLPHRKTESERW